MGVSENREPNIVLFIRTPKEGTPNFRKLPYKASKGFRVCKLCQTWPPEKLPLRSCPMELRELPLVNLPIYLRVVEDGQMPSSMASRQALLKLARASRGASALLQRPTAGRTGVEDFDGEARICSVVHCSWGGRGFGLLRHKLGRIACSREKGSFPHSTKFAAVHGTSQNQQPRQEVPIGGFRNIGSIAKSVS